jgi:hypothetical protein
MGWSMIQAVEHLFVSAKPWVQTPVPPPPKKRNQGCPLSFDFSAQGDGGATEDRESRVNLGEGALWTLLVEVKDFEEESRCYQLSEGQMSNSETQEE